MKPLYKPSDWGALFHTIEGVDELLGAGSAGPGKSMALLMDPITKVIQEHQRCENKKHPYHIPFGHSSGWALHLRREFSMLEQTIGRAHRIFKELDPGVRWDSTSHTFIFASGYHYQFGHCQHREDFNRYMSNEYDHIMYDEANQFLEEQYEQINSRLRSSDPLLGKQLKVRLMSNPVLNLGNSNVAVDDPFWLRRKFVDPAPEGNVRHTRELRRPDGRVEKYTIMYLPAKLKDNPDPAFVESYERTLISKKPHIRRALLDGDWYVTAGAFYEDSWDPAKHVCKPFKIPKDWPQFRCMDWGYKKPGCIYWCAVDPEDTLYFHKEYTFQGKSATEIARNIRPMEEAMGLWQGRYSRVTGPADTQLWEERGESGMSKAAEFATHGVTWVRADKRSRRRNAERLQGRFTANGPGGIVFFDSCKMATRTIPSIPTSSTNPEEPMDGGDDHWHDAVCYGCAHASRGRDAIAVVPDDDEDWGEDEAKECLSGRARMFGYG
jgi:phage terminase large subunit